MAVLGSSPSSSARAPCCADCATPAERRQIRGAGAALVLGAAASGRRPYAELLGDLETDWVPKRTEIEGATEELNGKVLAFQHDTIDQWTGGSIDSSALQGYQQAWNSFVSDFQAWRGDSLWVLTWRRRNQLLEYRARFNNLLSYWAKLPGASAADVPGYTPEESGQDKPDDNPWATTAKWVAIGALGVAGAYAVAKVTGLAGKFTPAGLASGVLHHNPRPRRRRRRRRAACCS